MVIYCAQVWWVHNLFGEERTEGEMSRRDYKEVIESKLGSKQNIREGKSTGNVALK